MGDDVGVDSNCGTKWKKDAHGDIPQTFGLEGGLFTTYQTGLPSTFSSAARLLIRSLDASSKDEPIKGNSFQKQPWYRAIFCQNKKKKKRTALEIKYIYFFFVRIPLSLGNGPFFGDR